MEEILEKNEKFLFEEMPVARAVATLAIPTIISQIVTMIYNLADTFFVGQIGDPLMVAAVSLVSPWFNLLTALGNLFGLGGSSLISRMLGAKNHRDVKYVAAFSIWGGAVTTLLFSLITYVFRAPLLTFLGASPDTYSYAEDYLFLGRSAGRRSHHDQPNHGAPSAQRRPREACQRWHDVWWHP